METDGILKLKLERLDFVLPEFPVRVSWTSKENQKLWEGRIRRISGAWKKVERERDNSIDIVEIYNLPYLIEECNKIGKIVVPLQKIGLSAGYGNTTPFIEGQPYKLRVAITTLKDYEFWAQVPLNDLGMGELLGYPPCCIKFFIEYWVEGKYLDTTLPMAFNTCIKPYADGVSDYSKLNKHTIEGHDPKGNILLRWLGVRLVSHLPCSFNCVLTLKIANDNMAAFFRLGFQDELEWLLKLLRMEISYSALHGIAEIKTPLFRFIARTDATGREQIVILKGEGKEEDTWTDNGFSSKEAMERAHDEMLMVFKPGGDVLDLGCGNGIFLSRLKYAGQVFGIDNSPHKIIKAEKLLSKGTFKVALISDFKHWTNYKYDAIYISINRFFETEFVTDLLNHLYNCTKILVVYTYGDGHRLYENRDMFNNWNTWTGSSNIMVLRHD